MRVYSDTVHDSYALTADIQPKLWQQMREKQGNNQ